MIRAMAAKNTVSVMLVGSAALLPAESWFGEALHGIEAKTVLTSGVVPSSSSALDTAEFDSVLSEASGVISI